MWAKALVVRAGAQRDAEAMPPPAERRSLEGALHVATGA